MKTKTTRVRAAKTTLKKSRKSKINNKINDRGILSFFQGSGIFVVLAVLILVASFFVARPIFAQRIEERIIFSDSNQNIVSVAPDGTDRQVIGSAAMARVSPDGSKVAFINGACGLDLCVMDYDGKNLIHLTTSPFEIYESDPQWSPDGTQLIYESGLGGTWIINSDGTNARKLTATAQNAQWSPVGTQIVFASNDGRIATADADGTNIAYLTPNTEEGREPSWSPDGSYIAWTASTSPNKISVIHPDGSGRTDVVVAPVGGTVDSPDWSPDSTRIVFTQNLGSTGGAPNNHRLFITDLQGNTEQIYADNNGVRYPSWARLQIAPPDTTSPTISTLEFSLNPKPRNVASNLVITASDSGSGVRDGEYFVGSSDPGVGGGTFMGYDGTDLRVDFGTDLANGIHPVNARVRDIIGNWSPLSSTDLVVYTDGLSMTGRRTITPNLSNGDVLPGLIINAQSDKATFSLSVKYDGPGHVAGSSSLGLKYSTGKCGGRNPQNCHNFDLSSTAVSWLYTQGVNDSEGIFQGPAHLVVDGSDTPVTFRASAVDGARLTPATPDKFELKVYPSDADPSVASPIYVIHSAPLDQGDIKIN